VNNSSSDLKNTLDKLKELNDSFEKIKAKKEELFSHQNEMKLGHRQL
jgi:hypothetical protein